jgi:hypothetical protein
MRYLLIAILLASCGQATKQAITIDPLTVPILIEIQLEAADRDIVLDLSKISIKMVDDIELEAQPNAVAACVRQESYKRVGIKALNIRLKDERSEHKEIQILKDVWNRSYFWGKYSILIHEVGHCYFDLEHTDEELNFMSREVPNMVDVANNWARLNDIFFKAVGS